MNVIIEAPFTLNDQQRKDIENEVHTLKKYNFGITKAEVYFKKDDGTEPDVILAEIKLSVTGPDLFASAKHKDYSTALVAAINKADRQLRRAKDIKSDHH